MKLFYLFFMFLTLGALKSDKAANKKDSNVLKNKKVYARIINKKTGKSIELTEDLIRKHLKAIYGRDIDFSKLDDYAKHQIIKSISTKISLEEIALESEGKLKETEFFKEKLKEAKNALILNAFFEDLKKQAKEGDLKDLYNKLKSNKLYSYNISIISFNNEKECYRAVEAIESESSRFESLASKSLHPSKTKGGNLGSRNQSQIIQEFGNEFFQAVNSMSSGDVSSEPVKGSDGKVYLIKLISKKEEKFPEFKSVESELRTAWASEKAQKMEKDLYRLEVINDGAEA